MSTRLLLAFLLATGPVVAAPTGEQAKALVEGIVGWSLLGDKDPRMPVEWSEVAKHKAEFTTELIEHMEWVGTPHPDTEGRDWHYDVDPLWQVQASGITSVKIGNAKAEGNLQLVVVDYVSPSAISATRPPTRYHNVWVVSEQDGKPVLQDIRYHSKNSTGHARDGHLLADLKQARANFKAP